MHASRFPSCKPASTRRKANSPPTAAGSRTRRTNRAATKFMCARFRKRAAYGKYRPAVPANRGGARAGQELFYIAADAHLMAVSVRATSEGRAIDAGTPLMLFPTHLANGQGISLTGYQSRALYAVTRDGRFLMNANAGSAAADIPPLTVVLNWQEELKQRVPTR
jgi:hypothetical protein